MVFALTSIIGPAQAWSALRRHAEDDVGSLRLVDLRGRRDVGVGVDDDSVAVHRSNDGGGNDDDDGHLLIVDWSRQRTTSDTMGHLLRYSAAMEVRERILDLAYGRLAPCSGSSRKRREDGGGDGPSEGGGGGGRECEYDEYQHDEYDDGRDEYDDRDHFFRSPTVSFASDTLRRGANRDKSDDDDDGDGATVSEMSEGCGSMHLALRMPAGMGMFVRDPQSDDNSRKNALDDVHADWRRVRRMSESVRRGKIRGASGRPLCDVLVLAAGGEGVVLPHALEFAHRAIAHDGVGRVASLVDPSCGSIGPSSSSLDATTGSTSGRVWPSSSTGGGGEQPTMASTLQAAADGVVSMVTTPFKSASGGGSSSSSSTTTSLRRRKLRILTSIDPSAMREVLSELIPATTLVVTVDVDSEGGRECGEITSAVRDWLLSGLMSNWNGDGGGNNRARAEEIVRKHMYMVTGNEGSFRGSHPGNAFLLPRHSRCEAFSTFSVAGILPLSLVFGWDITSAFLLGAHDMDKHFVDTCPRQNIPIILSLIDLWNEAFLLSNGRVLDPFVGAFGSYHEFVASLENKVLGASGRMPTAKSGNVGRNRGPHPVIDGGSYAYNIVGCGTKLKSIEFITTLDPILPGSGNATEDSLVANHDKRMCSLFARADTLAFGASNAGGSVRKYDSPGSPPMILRNDSILSQSSTNGVGGNAKTVSGNQPSSIILCGKCDAFTCGQLIALGEHRALIKAWLWDIDPFAVAKTSIQKERQDFLSERLNHMSHLLSMGDDFGNADGPELPDPTGGIRTMNSATNTVLKHYATRLKHRHRNKSRTPSRLFS